MIPVAGSLAQATIFTLPMPLDDGIYPAHVMLHRV